MGRRGGQARQILRHLLVGRITFTPQADGTVEFLGYADPGPLFAGTALAGLSKVGVSRTGFDAESTSTWTCTRTLALGVA